MPKKKISDKPETDASELKDQDLNKEDKKDKKKKTKSPKKPSKNDKNKKDKQVEK